MMTRLFRDPHPGLSAYAALILFVVVHLAAMSFVVAPRVMLTWAGMDDTSPDLHQPGGEE
jgi:hypothetical protein